ncbi:atrial natriuretic peptide receptor 1-like [Liolophura sinensis]|uniref:atrial natriuretic peptide receptor 1-like n=1 Tax=Liolophura sinensis TaxID=3198878 RepID=UPI00315826DB
MTSGGAVSLALKRAEENGLFSDVNLSVMWKNTECSESEALGESVELHMRHQVDVFIGPACHSALKAVSLLASYWEIPILSWFPIETNLTMTTDHSQLISLYGSYSDINDAIFGVLRHFSWSKIGILRFEDDFICNLLYDVIQRKLAHHQVGLLHSVAFADDSSATIRQGLEAIQARARRISGDVTLTENGVRIPKYRVLHYQNGELAIIGTVTTDYVPSPGIKVIWSAGETPKDSPKCGFHNELCIQPGGFPNHSAVIIGSVLTTAVVFGLVLTCFTYRRLHYERSLVRMTWSVDERDLKLSGKATLPTSSPPCAGGATSPKPLVRMNTSGTLGLGSACSLDRNQQLFTLIGNYRGCVVAVKRFKTVIDLTREVLKDLKALKELHHENLNAFIGAAFKQHGSLVLTQYCSKGSLQDVLENDDFKLDMTFKLSFAMDIARGMTFLHGSPIRSHGNLKSSNCVLDSRWVVKVTDYGVITEHLTSLPEDMGPHQYYSHKLWTAPELLRLEHPPRKGTQPGDVYSFGVILSEILLRTGPFSYNNKNPEEVVALVKTSGIPYRPAIPFTSDVTPASRDLMTSCWEECPDLRPNFTKVKKQLVQLNGGRKTSMFENMLKMLESHTNNLEELVTQRTRMLELEKQKTDKLLHQMLPKPVANQLKLGEIVQPETYEESTIFFSDIVGFTAISSSSTPMQVVNLLNELYITFDTIIPKHDVYKVETIGDAYMCVSGVPTRNGNRHVVEISNMALELLNDVRFFEIRHMPGEQLQLRIGVHTGPCVAGVVGLAMPRYCLFGDTVNMASRMESTGKELSIHISDVTNEALCQADSGFVTVRRGWIDVKGKGQVLTHWLIGKTYPTGVTNSSEPKPESDIMGSIG